MAREASPSDKRIKDDLSKERRMSQMSKVERARYMADRRLKDHIADLDERGIKVKLPSRKYDSDGHVVGHMDMSGHVQTDNFMVQHLLAQGAPEVRPDDKNKRFDVIWDEKTLDAKHRQERDLHEASRKRKALADSDAIRTTKHDVSGGKMSDLEQYMSE